MTRWAFDSERPLTPGQIDALAAWWDRGSVTGAAEALGLSVQTVKNQLHEARLRMRVATTPLLLQAAWQSVAERYPHLRRRLRYAADDEYRERARNQSKDAMRRMRTKRGTRSHNSRREAA